MLTIFRRALNDAPENKGDQIVSTYVVLIAANLAAWAWAFIAFRHFPQMLEMALLAYSFGLRHAVDADHIAAIDNVTRKLSHDGKTPVAVGLFFSLGHSTIVVLTSVAVAATTLTFARDITGFHALASSIGTTVSSLFLLIISVVNAVVLVGVYRTFRHVRSGGRYAEEDLGMLLARGGLLTRIFRPLFGMIRHSWHMYPLGILFGLGFDTATEVGLLGISAAEASKGLPIWSILVFPALFTAGMSLIDTTDSVFMSAAYGWAFVKPIRKIYYNISITAMSVIAALAVGGIEALGLIGGQLNLDGPFWRTIGALNSNSGTIGYIIIGIFVVSWAVSLLVYRTKRYDEIEVRASGGQK
jgi:nickel/cobalt transporter (NiCoT) family protein